MTNPASHLRLYVEEITASQPPRLDEWPALTNLCSAFESTTGWTLRRVRRNPSENGIAPAPTLLVSSDQLIAELASTEPRSNDGKPNQEQRLVPALAADRVRPLAEAINVLFGDLQRTHIALWQREADLAAGVPISASHDEREKLAERLRSILQSGATAVGCQAAALYMLDESTSELKLRSSWGLPHERFLSEPRELRTAIADLEALLGQAVVLEDTRLLPHWRSPEDFPAAVCVPVASPTMPLGTLWAFSREKREFTDEQTNILEIVAGRLAAELERAILLRESSRNKQRDRQSDRVVQWQRGWLPSIEPLIDGWQVAGWSTQDDRVGGEFFDWSVLPSGELSVAVGASEGIAIEASLTSAACRAAFKAHLSQSTDVRQVMRRLNETICMGGSGDQWISLGHALIAPETGDISYSLAGRVGAVLLGKRNVETTVANSLPLGSDPDESFSAIRQRMDIGDTFVLFSLPDSEPDDGEPIDYTQVTKQIVQTNPEASAAEMIDSLRQILTNCEPEQLFDHSFLVVRRAQACPTERRLVRNENDPVEQETSSDEFDVNELGNIHDIDEIADLNELEDSSLHDPINDDDGLDRGEVDWHSLDVVMPEFDDDVAVASPTNSSIPIPTQQPAVNEKETPAAQKPSTKSKKAARVRENSKPEAVSIAKPAAKTKSQSKNKTTEKSVASTKKTRPSAPKPSVAKVPTATKQNAAVKLNPKRPTKQTTTGKKKTATASSAVRQPAKTKTVAKKAVQKSKAVRRPSPAANTNKVGSAKTRTRTTTKRKQPVTKSADSAAIRPLAKTARRSRSNRVVRSGTR